MPWDEDYFEVKERKSAEKITRDDMAYAEKRLRLASLWKMDPASQMYKNEIKSLCCCTAPYVDTGCVVHGIAILVYEKALVWKLSNSHDD
jgi:hypothetical protein